MIVFLRLRKLFTRHFLDLSGWGLLAVLAGYFVITWILLYFANEHALLNRQDFLYWLIVSASTVGYGDLSPSTPAGKLIVAVFVIPFGLGLFALVVGRVAVFSASQWKKGIRGEKMLTLKNHVLVIGWNEKRTLHLLRLLIEEAAQNQQRNIALCTTQEIENPLPDEIQFVRVNSFTDDEQMRRAAVTEASCIIINSAVDDVTMTTALYCSGVNKDAHIIVYFSDDSLSQLLKTHCPKIECMPSIAVEMQVKAAMDPGSSVLHQELLNASQGMTQYSISVPLQEAAQTVEEIFLGLKSKYDATLIGIRPHGQDQLLLNPPLDISVEPGATLYYIADNRIKHIDWGQLRA